MNDSQNNKLLLINTTSCLQKTLKFCYFLMLCTFLVSCKDQSNNQRNQDENDVPATTAENSNTNATKTILCFGDSITAGYGLDSTDDAYPAVLQSKIDALGLGYTMVNSGVSGETSAGGRSRIEWILNQDIAIFILELGANDGLRGLPFSQTQTNLQDIIDAVKQKDPNTIIILAGMELPPNMGPDYTTEFRTMYASLAKQNNLPFIPFLLKDVGGIPELNQNDGIHPTVEGHKIVANTVWEVLKPLLGS
ncbi:arylesterase [Algibacter mikhailovii]|nr:arylesterase [Algibacter mikhailovii]